MRTARIAELFDGRRASIRQRLDILAFGANAWRGAEPGDRIIDDHHEEVEEHEIRDDERFPA